MSLDFLTRTRTFKDLVRAVLEGERPLSVRGVADAAKPYVLASLVRKIAGTLVFVRPSSAPLEPVEEACRFFLSELGSEGETMILPPLADNPYFEISPSLDAVSSRMRFLHALIRRPPSLVITNLAGLLKPIPSPRDLESLFFRLEVGGALDREEFLETLRRYGYAPEDLIASPGEFAWRGGIVDVYSPWEANPLRIEFGGSKIVSLREFDISSQKSLKRIERALIPGLREFPASAEFLESWITAARERAGTARADLDRKSALLRGGEFFPTFPFLAPLEGQRFATASDYLRDCVFVLDEPGEIEADWETRLQEFGEQHGDLVAGRIFTASPEEIYPAGLRSRIRREALRIEGLEAGPPGRVFDFGLQPVPRFANRIPFFVQYTKKLQSESDLCYIYLSNAGTRQRLAALLRESGVPAVDSGSPLAVPARGEAVLLLGSLGHGFCDPGEKVHVFAETDIFTEEKVIVHRVSRRPFFSQFRDLKAGDHVVHTDYGIGVFHGLQRLEIEGVGREFIEIQYRDGDKLLVPVEDLNLVQKFSRTGPDAPLLDKLGTVTWEKTKTKAKKAVEAVAKELLELYAQRKAMGGFPFSPAGEWEAEFEKTFGYEETPDQLRSIREVRRDMERGTAMDRLLCGDVGYGKTEVAMRAAFKAVMDGKQVAVLCPTTVLASQHLQTLRDRMVLFPVRIEALTRLQSRREQGKILEDLRKGFVDVVIGTHRLLSDDVSFKDLGLLVVDEEQRFGVSHKEKIKRFKANIDVLTLTATPIPRTLNMSMSGLRDISLIETPPRDRLSVHTVVTPFNARLIADAIKQELGRGGQVYYIHNRIEDIDKVAELVEKLVPKARVVAIHGRMTGAALEKRMLDFIAHKADVLVSTTIIENGIDIPLVNTLIVDRADLYGLAQLYQLRGRVGRSSRQAFAYFLVPAYVELTPLAKERLKALKEFSELGSGFRLAAKDLEIRGAGNLLGHRQHGAMEALGFDYYMHLLDTAIRQLKGERVEDVNAEINLKADIRIPEDYLPQINLRLNLYKRLASVEEEEEVGRIRRDIEDRFGPPPESVENLLLYGTIKLLARRLGVQSLTRLEDRVLFKFLPENPVDWTRIADLLKRRSGSLSPQGVLSLRLRSASQRALLDETVRTLKELWSCTTMN
jgi:transcription-repair coupling factor (superfamily II helicase)